MRSEPRPQARPLEDLDVDGSDERVLLVAGVFPGRLGQLPDQRIEEVGEPIDVGLGQGDRKGVGGDEPPNPHPAVEVHLPSQSTPDLDWLEIASEGLGQRSFHEALEPVLELLESHGLGHPTGSTQRTGPRRPYFSWSRGGRNSRGRGVCHLDRRHPAGPSSAGSRSSRRSARPPR